MNENYPEYGEEIFENDLEHEKKACCWNSRMNLNFSENVEICGNDLEHVATASDRNS